MKDSSQPINESDILENWVMKRFNHAEYLERPMNSSFLKESSLYSTVARAEVQLVKGVVCRDNPITVLCPILAMGIICHKGTGRGSSGMTYRPKLLVKNYGNPNLQLWSCEGCKDFLLKVNLNENLT